MGGVDKGGSGVVAAIPCSLDFRRRKSTPGKRVRAAETPRPVPQNPTLNAVRIQYPMRKEEPILSDR